MKQPNIMIVDTSDEELDQYVVADKFMKDDPESVSPLAKTGSLSRFTSPTAQLKAKEPKPVKESAGSSFGKKAMKKLNALLGRQKPWTEDDPVSQSYFSSFFFSFLSSLACVVVFR
uniref:Uncharacterized protein n=1 Tax=Spongospora subterranea TaxID=70186 RepID=A0A0H5RCX5_9EUKA|eukprot:CRZ11611.1 hypothetical protein [Spongospora subterranea]